MLCSCYIVNRYTNEILVEVYSWEYSGHVFSILVSEQLIMSLSQWGDGGNNGVRNVDSFIINRTGACR
jgi:hypothetical protein